MANSTAYENFTQGLKSVGNVLSFAKDKQGRPTEKERSLFVASVALAYAVWENYAEDLAIETVKLVAAQIDPDAVPDAARRFIEGDKPSPWQLSVHPGWRALWVERRQEAAKGNASKERSFGLLTADVKGVRRIFGYLGFDPFAGIDDSHIQALDALVSLRGEIVHTGRAPTDFYKANANRE